MKQDNQPIDTGASGKKTFARTTWSSVFTASQRLLSSTISGSVSNNAQ